MAVTRTNFKGEEITRFTVAIPIRIYHPDNGIPIHQRENPTRTQWEEEVTLQIDAVDSREVVEILTRRMYGLSDV